MNFQNLTEIIYRRVQKVLVNEKIFVVNHLVMNLLNRELGN